MFPNTAPKNGPGSSFNVNQNRLGFVHDITQIDAEINALPTAFDPDQTTIVTPVLPTSSLQVGLPAGQFVIDTRIGNLPYQNLVLPQASDVYIDAVVTGLGMATDFPNNATFVYQQSGEFAGSYLVNTGNLMATSALDLSQTPFTVLFSAFVASGNGGCGPGFVDGFGNGYYVRFANGGGGIYRTLGGVATTLVQALPYNTTSQGGSHDLQVTLTNGGLVNGFYQYTFTVYCDVLNVPIATITDTAGTLVPTSVFPAFLSDGVVPYITSWSWSNANLAPCVGWLSSVTQISGPPPGQVPHSRRFFIVTTGATMPVAIRNVFELGKATNKVRYLRDTLAQIAAAYN
jgi:hypothetical protein